MQWIEDRDHLDGRSLAGALVSALAVTVALIAFVSLVMAGVITWIAGVAGL